MFFGNYVKNRNVKKKTAKNLSEKEKRINFAPANRGPCHKQNV